MSFEFAPLDDPQSCPKLPSFPIELAKVLIDRLNPQDFEGYELDPLSFKAKNRDEIQPEIPCKSALTTKKSNKKKIDTAQPIDPNSTNPVDIGHRFGIKIIEIMSQADVEQRKVFCEKMERFIGDELKKCNS